MISANGGLPAHRYTPQVTQRWPRGSEPASHQYPVRLAFALTINQSQGQSFERVGLLLHDPVFAHGQWYVALSRATARNGIRVIIGERAWGNLDEPPNTPSIVWPEILF